MMSLEIIKEHDELHANKVSQWVGMLCPQDLAVLKTAWHSLLEGSAAASGQRPAAVEWPPCPGKPTTENSLIPNPNHGAYSS